MTILSTIAFVLVSWLAQLSLNAEPYGGCDEAHLYPDTDGAAWCQVFRPQP